MTIVDCIPSGQHFFPSPLERDTMEKSKKYFYTIHGVERAVKVIKEPMDTESIISDHEFQYVL